MNYNIIFESDNILFVDINESLINDYLTMVNDKNVSKYISLKDRTFSYEDELNWINDRRKGNHIIFSMIEKNTNKFIGNIEILEIKNNIGEMGICITPSKQDKHYGYESINRFIEYCLNELKLDNIELSVFSINDRAIHLYKKIGFEEYKINKNISGCNGILIDEIFMKYHKK